MHRMDISRSTIDREMAGEEQLVLNVLWLLYLFIYLFIGLFHRSNLYKGVSSPLPELSTLRVDEVYSDLPSEAAPLITTMSMDISAPLVDSVFGKVQEGSVLSYHIPAKRVPENLSTHRCSFSPTAATPWLQAGTLCLLFCLH